MVGVPLASRAASRNSSASVILSAAAPSAASTIDTENSEMREDSYIYMMSIKYKPMNH